MEIKILNEDSNYVTCEYIDSDNPYLKYKDSLVFETENEVVYKEVGQGNTLCCVVYYFPKNMPIKYNYMGIGNIWLTSLDDIEVGSTLREFSFKDEFLKYFKRRQVYITTYCAQNEYKYVNKPKRYLIRYGGIDMLKNDIGRDLFTLEKVKSA